jgi:CBS domain-containing protein
MTSTGQAAHAYTASIDEGETLRQAGHLMRELGVGKLGVLGVNGEARGVISRDMLVERIAAGGDPKTVTVGEVVSLWRPPARTGSGFPARQSAA